MAAASRLRWGLRSHQPPTRPPWAGAAHPSRAGRAPRQATPAGCQACGGRPDASAVLPSRAGAAPAACMQGSIPAPRRARGQQLPPQLPRPAPALPGAPALPPQPLATCGCDRLDHPHATARPCLPAPCSQAPFPPRLHAAAATPAPRHPPRQPQRWRPAPSADDRRAVCSALPACTQRLPVARPARPAGAAAAVTARPSAGQRTHPRQHITAPRRWLPHRRPRRRRRRRRCHPASAP
jgi:hypothetical protein